MSPPRPSRRPRLLPCEREGELRPLAELRQHGRGLQQVLDRGRVATAAGGLALGPLQVLALAQLAGQGGQLPGGVLLLGRLGQIIRRFLRGRACMQVCIHRIYIYIVADQC